MLDPAVMIFDDSTAAIDAATEQRIRAEMRQHSRERVTIIVAHRLSTVRHADRIAVMDKGRVVELGSHDNLVAAGGLYAHLASIQLEPDTPRPMAMPA